MGYDVGVYNSYGHRAISCSGVNDLRCSESEPHGDRWEIVGYPRTLSGARAMSVRSPYDF